MLSGVSVSSAVEKARVFFYFLNVVLFWKFNDLFGPPYYALRT